MSSLPIFYICKVVKLVNLDSDNHKILSEVFEVEDGSAEDAGEDIQRVYMFRQEYHFCKVLKTLEKLDHTGKVIAQQHTGAYMWIVSLMYMLNNSAGQCGSIILKPSFHKEEGSSPNSRASIAAHQPFTTNSSQRCLSRPASAFANVPGLGMSSMAERTIKTTKLSEASKQKLQASRFRVVSDSGHVKSIQAQVGPDSAPLGNSALKFEDIANKLFAETALLLGHGSASTPPAPYAIQAMDITYSGREVSSKCDNTAPSKASHQEHPILEPVTSQNGFLLTVAQQVPFSPPTNREALAAHLELLNHGRKEASLVVCDNSHQKKPHNYGRGREERKVVHCYHPSAQEWRGGFNIRVEDGEHKVFGKPTAIGLGTWTGSFLKMPKQMFGIELLLRIEPYPSLIRKLGEESLEKASASGRAMWSCLLYLGTYRSGTA
ncbi:hypothetical protein BDK51DRAFT_25468 [Blyttiomyces helicus]|uniref:Uncharacterized protein n=1 Tax=Blyttiomyces helicus TaxID=388810 RepID=A0A4P9WLF2_9FUNG|nr:hypothetical protein BDK51DRAFT_25468 [Blyttiomyces helicus]|eukprot:RKO93242.1 hypothetical protein BDK51DRAFT_25468 [Blyttiomyces helicus]